jgi:hypothetical protein
MATDVSDWIALTALVTSFLAYLEAKKVSKTSDAVEALTLVIDASEKTQTYLDKLAGGAERHNRTEYGLAEDWSRASFLMSRINKDLSVRLSAKSRFWRNPDTWDAKAIADKNISLEAVTKDARRLMEAYA